MPIDWKELEEEIKLILIETQNTENLYPKQYTTDFPLHKIMRLIKETLKCK